MVRPVILGQVNQISGHCGALCHQVTDYVSVGVNGQVPTYLTTNFEATSSGHQPDGEKNRGMSVFIAGHVLGN